MATATQHREISDRLLDHAQDELRTGDLLQASEKAWGAVAHFVNSVAKEQGWPSGSHRNLNLNAEKLIELTPDPDGNELRLTAMNGLHANFYEGYLSERGVKRGIEAAREFIDAMKTAAARLPG